jgi:Flp pilus assembly protein TadD
MRLYLIGFIGVMTAGLTGADTTAGTGLADAERLAREGEVAAALAAYRALSDSRPDSARLHARVGGMLLLQQDYAAAIRRFQTAIGLDPESEAEAFIGLGIAYVHLGQYGPARAALTEARRLKPGVAADLDPLLAWLDGRASTPAEQRR